MFVSQCGDASSPEGTIKAFFDEVNKGNTQTAKVYFSGQYSGGYDESDRNALEHNFPAGSIKNVIITNVKIIGESANLTVTIERTTKGPYTANLSLIKIGSTWKINYDGMSWPLR
jgi:hypothetical protein